METPDRKHGWQLTQESLDRLLVALHPNQEIAVARYQRLHGRLVLFFMRYRFSLPEDLADEVINRLAGKLVNGGSITNMEAFALGMARMVAYEEQARRSREQRGYKEFERNRLNTEHTSYEREVVLETMQQELNSLPPTGRKMLEQYHDGRGEERIRVRQRLAEEMGVTIGTLRKRVFDIQSLLRRRLKQAVKEAHESGEENRYL
jgi:DNA-directed RNA polymerase specialized sigma24 family protein